MFDNKDIFKTLGIFMQLLDISNAGPLIFCLFGKVIPDLDVF